MFTYAAPSPGQPFNVGLRDGHVMGLLDVIFEDEPHCLGWVSILFSFRIFVVHFKGLHRYTSYGQDSEVVFQEHV